MSYNSPFAGNVIQPTDVSFRAFSISEDTSLSWPINGNATDNYAARIMQVEATAPGLSLLMPPASQTSVGTDALILNTGTQTFTVKNADGGSIVTISYGEAKYIYVTDSSTVAGTWGVIDFGAGTSGGTASSLAGAGLTPISQTLNQSHPSIGLANGYTFTASDRAQMYVWSSGTGSVSLPSAGVIGDNWFVLVKNAGSGTLTIGTTGSQLIDSGLTKQFQPDESAFIVSNGAQFFTIGYGQSASFFLTVLTKAIAGGNYTLTAAETSNIIQEYVGTLSADVTVYYPPIVQLYVVSNQTVDNGYTLTLTTGLLGGANAIVPPGNQVTVICDGTNFLNANTVQAGASIWQVLDGSAAVPAIGFANETDTGIYRPAAGAWGVSIQGVPILLVNNAGINVSGVGTFTGGVSGGIF